MGGFHRISILSMTFWHKLLCLSFRKKSKHKLGNSNLDVFADQWAIITQIGNKLMNWADFQTHFEILQLESEDLIVFLIQFRFSLVV